MNKIITETVKIRGVDRPVDSLKSNSNKKVTVECKHGRREVRWSRRHQLCKKCAAEAGAYDTCEKGREVTWGNKISEAKRGVKFSDEHREALSAAQYQCSRNEWPGFYSKSDVRRIRDSTEYLEFRRDVMSRDDYQCVVTGKTGSLEVHHLDSVNIARDRILDVSNAVTLHSSVHSMFHLKFGNGNNTIEQFDEFKQNFRAGKKLFFLCGQSGVGKTFISNKLRHKFEVVHYDKSRNNLLEVLENVNAASNKPILLDIPNLISTCYKRLFGLYDIEMLFIIEDVDTVKKRILSRDGKITDSVEKRHERIKALYKRYGTFRGTSEEMLTHLRNLNV